MGFLIDAVAHGFFQTLGKSNHALQTDYYLAEINRPHLLRRSLYAGLSLMVWILKREVRASGGCLGMYRR